MNYKGLALSVIYGIIAISLGIWKRYTDWWWYDNLAHFSSGVCLGALVSVRESNPVQDLMMVSGLAVLWEIAEYLHGAYPWQSDLPQRAAAEDTLLDTILVLLGAALVVVTNNDSDT